jgi:hypothetical protein
MANINKFSPTSPDTFLKQESDMALAKFGHINAIVDNYNALDTAVTAISSTTGALKANSITEYTSGTGVTVNGALELKKTSSTTKSSTGTLTAVETATGYFVITGAATVLTLPSATALATQIGATAGTTFDIIVDGTGSTGTSGLAIPGSSGWQAFNTLTFTGGATIYPTYRINFVSVTSAVIAKLY